MQYALSLLQFKYCLQMLSMVESFIKPLKKFPFILIMKPKLTVI